MRHVFADAFYWIALLHAGDQWHQRVIAFTETLGAHHLYTTDAVFDEYLATDSARESYLRQQAAATVRRLLASPEVTVIHVLFVAYTERDERIRLIVARQATQHEQDDYFWHST